MKKKDMKTADTAVERVELTPREGLTVLDHMGRVIPEKGIKVVFSTFYSRLIKSGDVTKTKTGA